MKHRKYKRIIALVSREFNTKEDNVQRGLDNYHRVKYDNVTDWEDMAKFFGRIVNISYKSRHRHP